MRPKRKGRNLKTKCEICEVKDCNKSDFDRLLCTEETGFKRMKSEVEKSLKHQMKRGFKI